MVKHYTVRAEIKHSDAVEFSFECLCDFKLVANKVSAILKRGRNLQT